MNTIQVYMDNLRKSGMDPVNKIMDNLYLGNMIAANDREFILNNNIKLIIHCTKDFDIPEWYNEYDIKALRIPINDSNTQTDNDILKEKIQDVIDVVHTYRKNGIPVLIHCFAGVSRSATVTACYLIKYYKYSYNLAIFFLQYKRPITFKPYINFEEFLREFYIQNR